MILFHGGVNAVSGDGGRERFGNRFARVIRGFDLRHPLSRGDRKKPSGHHEGQHKEQACRSHASYRPGAVLRAQIDFDNGKGNKELGESYESEERTPERNRVETEGAFKDEKRQEKADPEKP